MNVVWHTDNEATRRFMVTQLGVAVVEAALTVLLAAIIGWWIVPLGCVALQLAGGRVHQSDIPVTKLLVRQRSRFLVMAFPRMSRVWSLASLAGLPIRLLRIAVLGFEPGDIVAPFGLHIAGRQAFIAPAGGPPPEQDVDWIAEALGAESDELLRTLEGDDAPTRDGDPRS